MGVEVRPYKHVGTDTQDGCGKGESQAPQAARTGGEQHVLRGQERVLVPKPGTPSDIISESRAASWRIAGRRLALGTSAGTDTLNLPIPISELTNNCQTVPRFDVFHGGGLSASEFIDENGCGRGALTARDRRKALSLAGLAW